MNYKKIVVSMIAIFIGMTAVNLINSLVYSTKAVYSDRHEEVTADINIVIDKANPDGEIEEIIDNSEYIEESFYISKAKSGSNYDIVVGVDIEEFAEFYNLTEGEQSEGSILLPSYKKAWESYNEDGSFVSTEGYEIGDLYTLNIDDNEYELPVSGFYDVNYESSVTTIANLHSTQAILLEKDFSKYYESKYIGEYWISTKKENIELVTNDFSEIDNTFITTTKQYEDMINGVMDMMIQFSTSVASLALLAGIILIITVTVLDVISRKRDFAIYKVVGFKQREISKMVLMEYGIITSLTAISASIFVYIITIVLTNYGDQLLGIDEEIFFDLKGSVIWNLVLIAFVLSLVHLVSKKTLSVKPKEVLRYE
jgi:ABC-type antimicrobial peptide transport system permease subunit